MALPAGRYGVTKNQLLKIKKLPMNTIKLIEELTEKFNLLGTAAFKNSTSVVTDSSDLVESGAVKDAIVGTTGWIGGNLLIFPYDAQTTTYAWGTVTVNGDGSIIVNGTPTERIAIKLETPAINYDLPNGDYILSLENAQNGSSLLVEGYNGLTWYKLVGRANVDNPSVSISIDHNGYTNLSVYISIESGTTLNNVKFKPMISKRGGLFVPYHPSVEQTLRDAEFVKGKNLYDGEQDINFGSAYNLRTITVTLKKPIGAGTYTLNYKAAGNGSMLSQIRYDGSFHGSSEVPYTFTVTQSCDKIYLYMAQEDYDANKTALLSEIQIEKGSQATAYQPYYVPLKDVVPTKADNSVIGTVEDGTNPTKAYAVGEFMVRDGAFCQVTAPVTTSSTWTEGSNYTKKSIAEVLQSLMS